MDFYVPTVGDKIYLIRDWTFKLYKERRNTDMAVKLELDSGENYHINNGDTFSDAVILPAKTCLKIDRIYIRKGQTEYDSISFRIESTSLEELAYLNDKGKKIKGKTQARFWVKLRDANRIQCQLDPIADTDAPAAKQSRFMDL